MAELLHLPSRRFGVEIEFDCLPLGEAMTVLEEAGIEVVFVSNYEEVHTTITTWKVVRDGSVSQRPECECGARWSIDCECGFVPEDEIGGEVVSPILQGEEGLAQVRAVLDALSGAGAEVSEDCGLHVHVDMKGLKSHEVVHIVRRYAQNEDEITRFHSADRADNEYCAQVSKIGRFARLLREGCTVNELANTADRYCTVNVHSVIRQNSLEFRQHDGSLEASVVCPWIRWCLHFVENSRLNGLPSTQRVEVDEEMRLAFVELGELLDKLPRRFWMYKRDVLDSLGWSYNKTEEVLNALIRFKIPISHSPMYVEFRDASNLIGLRLSEFWEKETVDLPAPFPSSHWSEGMPSDLVDHFNARQGAC